MPGSKSLTNRALVLAALADGPSTVSGALRARDSRAHGPGARVPRHPGSRASRAPATCTSRPGRCAARVRRLRPGRHRDAVRPAASPRSPTATCASTATRARACARWAASSRRSSRSASRSTTTAAARCPSPSRAPASVRGGEVTHRRVGVEPVRERAAALGRTLRRGSRRTPSRRPGALDAAHRHERRAAARARRARRRRRGRPPAPPRGASHPGRLRALDRAVEPDLSNAAPFLAAAVVTGGSVTVPALAARAPRRPATRCATCSRGWARASSSPTQGSRVSAGDRLLGPRRRPARRRRARPGARRGLRARRRRRRVCAASGTCAATRPTGSRRSPRRSRASAARSWRPTTASSSDRDRCTEACSRPTTTTAWPPPARCSASPSPASQVVDVATTGKTLPDFVALWQSMLDQGSRAA